ncbi:hypothetical protein IFM89_015982 [Coptis chinensis]|uniref:F-box protein n=1 Tax=Coptis chinensis TaxID=261450 RepID=A0A835HLC9_9MAGN|nr:hypothetical protein IFM89_015982 [Coptis chinensis]
MSVDVRKWEDMNIDCLTNVFERVGWEALTLHLPLVCKSWYKVSLYPQFWKNLDFKSLHPGYIVSTKCIVDENVWLPDDIMDPLSIETRDLELFVDPDVIMVKVAISRSCGMATKLVVPFCFMEDWVEDFLMSRSFHQGDEKAFMKLFSMLRSLEVLVLGPFDGYFWAILVGISHHCKNFLALSTNGYIYEEEASAIVELLPSIKYLKLRGSRISHNSLMVILDGCKELVLLDVSDCTGFDAGDEEILNLASRIKIFISEGSSVGRYFDYLDFGDDYYFGDYGSFEDNFRDYVEDYESGPIYWL